MKLQKFTVRDIVFTAIIAAAFILSGMITIPFVLSADLYGLTYLITSPLYAFFIVILLLKVKKPGCIFLAGFINGLVLCMMSTVMFFMQATGALLCEVITLLIFRSYEKKASVITAAVIYMPLVFPMGIVGNMLIKGGNPAELLRGGIGLNLVCYLGIILLGMLGAWIGWKLGSELKRAGKLK